MIPTWFWIALKTMQTGRKLAGVTAWFAFAGLVLGVASMVVAMAVVSGFETTLKSAIIDVTGHMMVLKRGKEIESQQKFTEKLKEISSEVQVTIPFVMVEAVAAHQGRLQGVIVEGVDMRTATENLGIKKRLIKGEFQFPADGESTGVIIGKGLAKNFHLQLGDIFRVVLPLASDLNPVDFKRKMGKFKVMGIVDLGKHQYNERYIFTELKMVQDFAGLNNKYHGMIVKIQNSDDARDVAMHLTAELGPNYWIKDWNDDNLFEAMKIEKKVIFFVLLLMVIVAAFNISSSLFINVVQRYADISVLKAMGATEKMIQKIFCAQGLVVGTFGALVGFILGLLFCGIFMVLQNTFGLIDGSVYKLDNIAPQIRWADNFAIFLVTLFICLLSTLAPAWRGARLKPVEGLRYE
jgi:lipoprotein-releasing system permease protein